MANERKGRGWTQASTTADSRVMVSTREKTIMEHDKIQGA